MQVRKRASLTEGRMWSDIVNGFGLICRECREICGIMEVIWPVVCGEVFLMGYGVNRRDNEIDTLARINRG